MHFVIHYITTHILSNYVYFHHHDNDYVVVYKKGIYCFACFYKYNMYINNDNLNTDRIH